MNFFFLCQNPIKLSLPFGNQEPKNNKKEDESKLAYHKPVTQGKNINRFGLLSKYKMRKGFGTE
jgi:hypothetical protein